MQITNQPITYSLKTSPSPTAIRVQLNSADFLNLPAAVNVLPGPGWTSTDVYDTTPANISPSFAGWSLPIDMTQAMTQSNLSDLQSVWIDNSVNPGYLQVQNISTGQILFCDAFSQ